MTIPTTVRDIHDFETGDTVTIEVYADGIWIGAGDSDE